jgi:hypothetical protein
VKNESKLLISYEKLVKNIKKEETLIKNIKKEEMKKTLSTPTLKTSPNL